jgi:N-sulfoglucosamine sulfohydrolase
MCGLLRQANVVTGVADGYRRGCSDEGNEFLSSLSPANPFLNRLLKHPFHSMIHRRLPLIRLFLLLATTSVGTATFAGGAERPNILIAISDDQSFPHASAYGSTLVDTPHFDRVAKKGVLFTSAFCASPGCSPSRAALLTGLDTWQIEHAGTHASYFHPKYETFPDKLAEAGYFVGYTGKGWGPGNFQKLGRETNPAGPRFSAGKYGKEWGNYAGAFANFLEQRPADQPFCFWFGSSDPHRGYAKGSGLEKGMKLSDATVPGYLPDTPEVRSDLLDYAFEVERFDSDLGKFLKLLEANGELENTLVIVTSDNGMPMPRAKANCYEQGIHMPLAICWGSNVPGERTVDDLIGFTDLTATIYDAAGVDPPKANPLAGKSMLPILKSEKSGVVDASRTEVFSARERHSSSRFNTLSYPQRCIRTSKYLYIRNFKPERWPAGPAQKYAQVSYDDSGNVVSSKLGPPHGGYHDIDACPTLTFLIQNKDDAKLGPFLELAVGKRPAEELFDVQKDPDCLNNLAGKSEFAAVQKDLSGRLEDYLKSTNDARVAEGNAGDVWETYPRVSGLRWFPEPAWAEENPESIPKQEWVEKARPRK